jgi:hypothetical protein
MLRFDIANVAQDRHKRSLERFIQNTSFLR